jgi:hypothetical protein
MPLSEIFDGFKGLDLKMEIFIGGLSSRISFRCAVTDEPMEGAFAIKPRVYMGGKWESIIQMIETIPHQHICFSVTRDGGRDSLRRRSGPGPGMFTRLIWRGCF